MFSDMSQVTYVEGSHNVAISDADFGDCESIKRSASGVVIIYAGGAISWRSQRQNTVALSTTELEIIVATEAEKKFMWFKILIEQMKGMKIKPTLYVDNAAFVKHVSLFLCARIGYEE